MSANPALTKTGKVKLGPLSLTQLKELLEKSSKPRKKNISMQSVKCVYSSSFIITNEIYQTIEKDASKLLLNNDLNDTWLIPNHKSL